MRNMVILMALGFCYLLYVIYHILRDSGYLDKFKRKFKKFEE